MNIKGRKKNIKHWKIIGFYLIIYDILAVNLAYFLALFLRFDMRFSMIPPELFKAFLRFAPIYTIFSLLVFWSLRLYRTIWRFASYSEINNIIVATLVTSAFHIVAITLFFARMPISYYLMGPFIQLFLISFIRFLYRYISMMKVRLYKDSGDYSRVMIIGAGYAGLAIIRELSHSTEINAKPICVIDDNSNKWHRYIEGVPVVGGRYSIAENVKKYDIDTIMFAIPTAAPDEKRQILDICKETKCELRSLPGLYQLANGEISLSKMQPVSVEDLLGRDPIMVNNDEIFKNIKGKTILVTGGGGSIGSELCRQLARHTPKLLIIFDIYENNAYDIEQELKREYIDLNLLTLIGSVRDGKKLDEVFAEYRPDLVFHAAAHKHVPLMETSPNEAIKNNVAGTYNAAYCALKYGAESFVLISTDKAVNPTNIMGASKRLCEMIIQSLNNFVQESKLSNLPGLYEYANDSLSKLDIKSNKTTKFVAVRFGNVLGSNGSVIPLFKKQIADGGPVTVTDPNIVRFFMTIPEAVSLILQAATYAQGGEIFVLDMGEPVKIVDLARNLIKLSGFTPDVDIKIQYTGLRPGEKLYEEKLMNEEGLKKTENNLIHIGLPIEFDNEKFFSDMDDLIKSSYVNSDDIIEKTAAIVTTFKHEK